MANQRREGQTFVGFQADARLVAQMDSVRKEQHKDRSLFIREALAEKLARHGVKVPQEWVMPPMREVKDVMLNEDEEGGGALPPREEVTYTAKKRNGARA